MLALLLLLIGTGATGDSEIPEPIHGYGSAILEPSCRADQLVTLKQQTYKTAGSRMPDQAWALTQALLCGTGKASQRYVWRHTPELVAFEEYGLSEDPGPFFSFKPRKEVHQQGKQVWGRRWRSLFLAI